MWKKALWLSLAMLVSASAWAASPVKVGGYPFPPFVDGKSGLSLDLIEAMNQAQDDYQFEFVETSANRRYQHMAEERFSLMLFENQAWGWDPNAVEASRVFLSGDGEVFVAKAVPGRGQSYFRDIHTLRLVGTLGYHYAFANYVADPDALKKKFRITLVADGKQALPLVLQDLADVAIVTKSWLQGYLLARPEDAAQLLVSERMDQVYQHTVLVRKGSKPTVDEVNQILRKLEASGALRKLWTRHGIVK